MISQGMWQAEEDLTLLVSRHPLDPRHSLHDLLGVSQNQEYLFSPGNILGSIMGLPYFGKLSYSLNSWKGVLLEII